LCPIYVYWLYNETCIDPQVDGYVGITVNFKRRMSTHRRSGNFPENFQIMILYEGTRVEARQIEFGLRPRWNMGWNKAPGGAECSSAAWNKGVPMSEEAKAKMILAKKGKKTGPQSEETKRKIGLANKGKGHPRSPETRQKMSEKAKLRCQRNREMYGSGHRPEAIEKQKATKKKVAI